MTAAGEPVLGLPIPIVFTVCQGVQRIEDGTFNILSIYDRITVYESPDGSPPESVRVQVLTVWTGGRGTFEQILNVLDPDGRAIREARQGFTLASTSARHYIVSLLDLPAIGGVYTLTVARPDMVMLRQTFTIEVAPFPSADR